MGYEIIAGDALASLRAMGSESVNCVVTSPPYFGLRDYGVDGQLGLEKTPEEYIARMVEVFSEVRRVMSKDGTLWLNLGDSYSGYHGNKNSDYNSAPSNKGGYFENQRISTVGIGGLKQKDLIGIPWMTAFALRSDGWYLRQDIIWHKPNPMPESVKDRCTKAHEYLFMLSKSERYFYDAKAVEEQAVCGWRGSKFTDERDMHVHPNIGTNRKDLRTDTESRHRSSIDGGQSLQKSPNGKRNKRSVWTIPTKPFRGAHFAVMPESLVEPCVLAGSRIGDVVMDPFAGSGTVGVVALRHGRKFIGVELNPEYAEMARKRIGDTVGLPFEEAA